MIDSVAREVPSLTPADLSSLHGYYEQKYGPEVMQATTLLPHDTVDSYRDRLFGIYTRPDQQAYLNGLIAVSRAGIYGMYAAQSYYYDQQRVPEVVEMFPEELNREMLTAAQTPDRKATNVLAYMDRDHASEVITACNLAAHHVGKSGDQLVADFQDMAVNIVLGRVAIKDLPLTVQFKLLPQLAKIQMIETLGGNKFVEELADQQVRRLVDHQFLELSTPRVAERFRDIASKLNGPVLPVELFVHITGCSLALDDLDIYLNSHMPFATLYNKVIAQTRLDWGKKDSN